MRSTLRSHSKAFTLLECLLVIAVLSVIVTLVVNISRSSMEKARVIQCANNLRQFGVAFLAYAGDHNGKYPPYPTDVTDVNTAWPYLISDYVGYNRTQAEPAIYACPVGTPHPSIPNLGQNRGYSMNTYVSMESYQNIRIGGKQALLLESWYPQNGKKVMSAVLNAANATTYLDAGASTMKDRLAWRHNERMNGLLKDGSVMQSAAGSSGWGEEIIWRVLENGTVLRDGAIRPQ